jgi:hypothetical protein
MGAAEEYLCGGIYDAKRNGDEHGNEQGVVR